MKAEHLTWPGAVVGGIPNRRLFRQAADWMDAQNINHKFIVSVRYMFTVLLIEHERDLTLVTLKFPSLIKGAIPGDVRQLLYDTHEADQYVERLHSETQTLRDIYILKSRTAL